MLSFLVPGLGQLYNGRLPKGILFFCVGCVIDIIPSLHDWAMDFRGFLLMLTLPLFFRLVVAAEAFWQARQLGEITLKKYTKWYVYVTAVTVAILLGILGGDMIGTRGLNPIYVTADSMMPGLEVQDRIMVNYLQYLKESPKRGDIVVFIPPGNGSNYFIKRVVGLPGEQVSIKDKKVMINGKPITDPYSVHLIDRVLPAAEGPRDNMGPIEIQEGRFFVMGDNRDYSNDSRFFGPVPAEKIVGKGLYIFWAKDRSRIGKSLQ